MKKISPQQPFDRNKILIIVHPGCEDLWFWLIPFSDGSSSLGVVGQLPAFAELAHLTLAQQLDHLVKQVPQLSSLLSKAQVCGEVRQMKGYSANVSRLYGERFALLGNAGEFLDPVFSSGVTIALQSAVLAAPLVIDLARLISLVARRIPRASQAASKASLKCNPAVGAATAPSRTPNTVW